jgi:hypothetical protein
MSAGTRYRPLVVLTGQDGNALAIIGACRRAAKGEGWSDQEWREVRDEMMAGSYDHLLRVAMDRFEIELEPERGGPA